MHNKIKHQRVRSTHTTVGLYSFVFAGKISVLAVLLLFVSFLIQPFHQALANESEPVEESVIADDVQPQEQESTEIANSQDDNDVTGDDSAITSEQNLDKENNGQENTEAIIDTSSQDDVDVLVEPESDPAEADSGGEEVLEPDPDIPIDEIPITATSSGESTTTPQSDGGDVVVSDDSEDVTVEPVPKAPTEYVITDENYYQFSKQSCVAVGEGTYHCSNNTDSVIDTDAVVFADKDKEEGDMEIFLRTVSGRVEQLSSNTLDDTSPHFDAESMKVVWQSLIDGRQQIIVYDLDEGEESQLTFSRNNNMEPKISKEGIVWQAWDGNDWEIMYFDGKYTDQITDNSSQDVAPVIEDGYILWSILGSNSQEAKVYSLDSGETLTITGHEGGSIVNPRFVLVYDTKFENGDVITQGFDPATGLSAPISAEPVSEPIKIPDVDPIGEIRALIQNKSSQKEDGGLDGVKTDNPEGDLGLMASSSATSSDTLNLKQIDMDVITEAPIFDNNFELTDYDLVIASDYLATSTNSKVNENFINNSSASSTQP